MATAARSTRSERSASVNLASLALLLDDNALRMAAAWPGVADRNDWADIAGVSAHVAERTGRSLLATGICLPGGGLAKEAQEYLVRRAFAPIAALTNRTRTKQERQT
jgi:hypothetical protein